MFKRNILFAVLTFFLFAGVLSAGAVEETPKEDVDKKELGTFIKAAKKVQEVETASEQEMIEVIKGEGFETNRYIEIVKMDKDDAANAEKAVSKEEFKKYSNAKKKIEEIQKAMEEKQIAAIESEGLKVERYIEIAKAASENPELGQMIRTEMEKK